ncbi:hypothetical protein JZ751_000574 [Albula glossodonta]|uniref:Uncharacterized protein n=1 Tax=Albula glossodonta TaxID=121402 RepID=A0A8T2PWZ2_9TELE|nr:hypothetical protein JZ751_000574 [Albula glossodonta]
MSMTAALSVFVNKHLVNNKVAFALSEWQLQPSREPESISVLAQEGPRGLPSDKKEGDRRLRLRTTGHELVNVNHLLAYEETCRAMGPK